MLSSSKLTLGYQLKLRRSLGLKSAVQPTKAADKPLARLVLTQEAQQSLDKRNPPEQSSR